MRVGLDIMAIYPLELSPLEMLDYCCENGFAGIQFGGVRDLSQNLDSGELKDVRARADELGLYSHVSVYPLNPQPAGKSIDEVVEELAVQVEAAAACDWHELHSSLGGPVERYEHSVPWRQQFADAAEVLHRLAPALRDNASRINLETHGDTTTFELVRLCEDAGPDIAGICLDTANVLCFAEHPVDAARRAAPYTHLTHAKDAIIFFCDEGLRRQGRPAGQGCLDWDAILPVLAEHEPNLPLSIEDHKWFCNAEIFRDEWLAGQADLSRDELARTVELAWQVQKRMSSGELPDPDEYEDIPYADQMAERLAYGRDYLNASLERLGLKS